LLKPVVLGGFALLAAGCATLSWYGQALHGQLDLLSRREDIADLLARPDTPDDLRERLRTVLAARDFAWEQLGLPESRSYETYADLERDAAVWNVIATPPYSMEPKRWCYPLVGCLAYRGYFRRDRAFEHARRLGADGFDVAVMPAVAYSTLGWFADPVVSTMLEWSDGRLAGFIFHELTHEKLFLSGATAFNEAYATVVERHGVRRWLEAEGQREELGAWQREQRLLGARVEILLDTRAALADLFASTRDEAVLAPGKRQEYRRLTDRLAALAVRFDTDRLDGWIEADLNNAHLAMVATYEQGVGAFERLLADCSGDIACFHAAVARLADADERDREEFLSAR
jgi:predicted aminopeptidase